MDATRTQAETLRKYLMIWRRTMGLITATLPRALKQVPDTSKNSSMLMVEMQEKLWQHTMQDRATSRQAMAMQIPS